MIAVNQKNDIALFEHVRANTFERMRRDYDAGSGPFVFHDRTIAMESISGKLFRNLVARPLLPLIAR